MTGGTSRFAGKVAVVTGGGLGIGRAICLILAEGGANVVVGSNVAEQAGTIVAEICTLGVKEIARTVDVTHLAAVEALSAEVEMDLGGANILVTCAGVMGARKLITETSAAEWHRTIAINLDGTIGLTETIAIELGMLGKNGVNANALCRGPIDTPMMEAITDHLAPGMNMDREKFRKVVVAKNI